MSVDTMNSFSLDDVAPSSSYSKLRRRCTVARNASTMTKQLIDSCDPCASTVNTKSQQSTFRLPFEAKIVSSLVFFAATVSICRTTSLLRHFDAIYAVRSLNAVQNPQTKLRVRFQNADINNPRVVFWDENAEFILQLSKFKPFDLTDEQYNDDNENDLAIDPTRQYDHNDSADLPTLERPKWPNHEFDPHCQPAASWQTTFHPTCNEIHSSADIKQVLVDGEFSLLSRKGYWRHAWLHHKEYVRNDKSQSTMQASKTVWKTLKFSHRYEEKYFEDTRVDAVAMERLTASPYIINIYGFCGLTVVQEYGGKDLTRALAGGKMTSLSKLKLAKQVAEGLHHIHSIRDSDNDVDQYDTSNGFRNIQQQQVTLVHNDINLANLLFTVDNRPMLNDFNIAKLVMRHNITGEMCPFYSNFPNPQWKAPEEQVISDFNAAEDNVESSNTLRLSHQLDTVLPIVNEKVDIYALGNVFYRLLTGLNPWRPPNADRLYDADKAMVARMKKFHGATPPVPDDVIRYASTDSALQTILDVMNLCYRYDPEERPTALEIVQRFEDAIIRSL